VALAAGRCVRRASMAAASGGGGTMVGAIANFAVAARRLIAAPAVAAAATGDAEAPAGLAGVDDWAGWPLAGARAIAGLGSPVVEPATGRDTTDPGWTDLSVAKGPGRTGAATDWAAGLTGIPGTGPPPHIRVLAGEADLFAPRRLATGAAMTIALPHAGQRITGCAASGWVAGSEAWQ